jgi:hypothetical protein
MVEAAVFFIIGKGSSSASGLGRQFFSRVFVQVPSFSAFAPP